MFLQVCVILFTGGCVSQDALQEVSQHALQQVSRGCVYPSMHCRRYPSMPCSRSQRPVRILLKCILVYNCALFPIAFRGYGEIPPLSEVIFTLCFKTKHLINCFSGSIILWISREHDLWSVLKLDSSSRLGLRNSVRFEIFSN